MQLRHRRAFLWPPEWLLSDAHAFYYHCEGANGPTLLELIPASCTNGSIRPWRGQKQRATHRRISGSRLLQLGFARGVIEQPTAKWITIKLTSANPLSHLVQMTRIFSTLCASPGARYNVGAYLGRTMEAPRDGLVWDSWKKT